MGRANPFSKHYGETALTQTRLRGEKLSWREVVDHAEIVEASERALNGAKDRGKSSSGAPKEGQSSAAGHGRFKRDHGRTGKLQ